MPVGAGGAGARFCEDHVVAGRGRDFVRYRADRSDLHHRLLVYACIRITSANDVFVLAGSARLV